MHVNAMSGKQDQKSYRMNIILQLNGKRYSIMRIYVETSLQPLEVSTLSLACVLLQMEVE